MSWLHPSASLHRETSARASEKTKREPSSSEAVRKSTVIHHTFSPDVLWLPYGLQFAKVKVPLVPSWCLIFLVTEIRKHIWTWILDWIQRETQTRCNALEELTAISLSSLHWCHVDDHPVLLAGESTSMGKAIPCYLRHWQMWDIFSPSLD